MGNKRFRLRWENEEHIDPGNLASEQEDIDRYVRDINDGRLYCQTLILEERCESCGKWEVIDSLGYIMIYDDEHEIEQRREYELDMLRGLLVTSEVEA